LRHPYEELDFRLGDAVTESMAKIVAGVFDGDTDTLFALIADSSIDGFVREALFGAASFLARERRIDRDRLREVPPGTPKPLLKTLQMRRRGNHDHRLPAPQPLPPPAGPAGRRRPPPRWPPLATSSSPI
jgi:hypothetical protein